MGHMSSGSWASYQAALPIEARAGGEPDDDEYPPPGRHDHEGPECLVVEWFIPMEYDDVWPEYDPATETYRDVAFRASQMVPVGRWFPAERWAWKHAKAWETAMKKRHGHASVEEIF